MFRVQTIHQLYKYSIINSQFGACVIHLYLPQGSLMYDERLIFVYGSNVHFVTLKHLLIRFNYNCSKRGGHDIDFAHILPILLNVHSFVNVTYTRSSFLKLILIGLTHREISSTIHLIDCT